MSRKRDCWEDERSDVSQVRGREGEARHNALRESADGRVQVVCVDRGLFRTRAEAQRPLLESIDYCHTGRRDSTLGKLLPVTFEQRRQGAASPSSAGEPCREQRRAIHHRPAEDHAPRYLASTERVPIERPAGSKVQDWRSRKHSGYCQHRSTAPRCVYTIGAADQRLPTMRAEASAVNLRGVACAGVPWLSPTARDPRNQPGYSTDALRRASSVR